MNTLILVLVSLALVATQVLAGGRHLALCLPGYGLLALAALLGWWPALRNPVARADANCLAAAALFLAYVAGRALFSPEEYLAREDLYMALGAAMMYLLVALSLTSREARGLFVGGLIVLAIANCIIGAVQFAQDQNFMVFDFLPRSNYGSRASGFYGYPNHLAVFLEVTLLLGAGMAFWSRWPAWVKIAAGYGSLVCLLGILLTGSRGAYVGSVVGLVIFGLLSLRLVEKLASGRAIILMVAGGLMLLVMGWGVQHFLAKSSAMHSRIEQLGSLDTTRLQLWQAAGKQFKLQPVVGTGSGTSIYYGRRFRDRAIQTDPVHAHNEYLELLAEYGILGIAAAMMFLDTHLRGGWKSFSVQISRPSDSLAVGSNSLGLTMGALSAAAACLAHSFVDFTLHMPANMLVMAFVFGLLANPGDTRESASNAEQIDFDLSRYALLALPALGLWIAVRALPTWPAEYYAEKARTTVSDWRFIMAPEVAQTAEAFARRGLAWDARNAELHLYRGEAQAAMAALSSDPIAKNELYAHAASAYANALGLAPNDVRLVLCLASSLDALQRFAESEPLYKRAVELDPRSANVRFAYASQLHLMGKWAEADAEYRQSLSLGSVAAQAGLKRLAEELKARKSGETTTPEPRRQP